MNTLTEAESTLEDKTTDFFFSLKVGNWQVSTVEMEISIHLQIK